MKPKVPGRKTVYTFFTRLKDKEIWNKILEKLIEVDNDNRINICESVIAIDSQSVKTQNRFEKIGYDGDEEKIKLLNAI